MTYSSDVAAAQTRVAAAQVAYSTAFVADGLARQAALDSAVKLVAATQEVDSAQAALQRLLDNPPTSVTKFPVGVSLGKGNRGGLTGWPAYRIYVTSACPSDIASMADVRTAIDDGARYICVSWKDTSASRVTAFAKSAAKLAASAGVVIDGVYYHEVEDNMAGSAYLPTARAHRQIWQGQGLKFGPMLQAWTFNPKSRRNWRDWYDPDVDFLGVEAYNPGRKKTPPIFEPPSEFLDRVFTVLKETGKPTVGGEFGMPVDPKSAATRPAYIKSIVQYYRDHCPVPVRALLYWDSVVSNDNRLDRAAAQALQSMNA